MKLYERWSDKDFQRRWMDVVYNWEWKDYDDFEMKYGSSNIEAFSSSFSVSAFFEGIGVLVKRKFIDIGLVDDLMSTSILWYWEKTAPYLIESRKRLNRPQLLEWGEYLFNEMRKREKQTAKGSKETV